MSYTSVREFRNELLSHSSVPLFIKYIVITTGYTRLFPPSTKKGQETSTAKFLSVKMKMPRGPGGVPPGKMLQSSRKHPQMGVPSAAFSVQEELGQTHSVLILAPWTSPNNQQQISHSLCLQRLHESVFLDRGKVSPSPKWLNVVTTTVNLTWRRTGSVSSAPSCYHLQTGYLLGTKPEPWVGKMVQSPSFPEAHSPVRWEAQAKPGIR